MSAASDEVPLRDDVLLRATGIARRFGGVQALRESLEQMVSYALRQKLITRRVTADDLFADAVRVLGDEGH